MRVKLYGGPAHGPIMKKLIAVLTTAREMRAAQRAYDASQLPEWRQHAKELEVLLDEIIEELDGCE